MISTTILGWSVTTLAIAGLIIATRIRKRKKYQNALAPLVSFASENNATLSHYDLCDKTLIGLSMDEPKRIFFIRPLPERETRVMIPLKDIKACRMHKSERTSKLQEHSVVVIDRIEMLVSLKNSKTEMSLEFYNTDFNALNITDELLLAQKWTDLLKSNLNDQ